MEASFKSSSRRKELRFKRISTITVVAVYFLFLVGSIVRASGAGMGCPDWPTCFGRWIPPVSESQLPQDYQEIYAERGYAETTFNATKTWTEYINRLIGATIGILILVTFWASFTYWGRDPMIVVMSFFALVFVVFNAWLGSILIETNLAGWSISLHLGASLLVILCLLNALVRSYAGPVARTGLLARSRLAPMFLAVLLLSLVQIYLGTEVRQEVDLLAQVSEDRGVWTESLGNPFLIHRSFSILVLLLNFILVFRIGRATLSRGPLWTIGLVVCLLLLAEAGTGAALYYLEMPVALQPVHLLLATMIFGLQYVMWLQFRRANRDL